MSAEYMHIGIPYQQKAGITARAGRLWPTDEHDSQDRIPVWRRGRASSKYLRSRMSPAKVDDMTPMVEKAERHFRGRGNKRHGAPAFVVMDDAIIELYEEK